MDAAEADIETVGTQISAAWARSAHKIGVTPSRSANCAKLESDRTTACLARR
jgi:hypothetical protein